MIRLFLLSTAVIFTMVHGQDNSKSLLALENEKLLQKLKEAHTLTEQQVDRLRELFQKSTVLGQGNPLITKHPVTPDQCREKLQKERIVYENRVFEKICGEKYMAPLYDTASEKAGDATVCIDQFEFPNIPCEYPVVWVRAREAEEICAILGKRMCDAHEWEGACDGALLEADYRFDLAVGRDASSAIRAMRKAHNQKWGPQKKWAYGSNAYQKDICSCRSSKSEKCQGGSWSQCGSNTYPSGYSPKCRSALGVYDMHGNAAEHMNLPLNEAQMSSRGSKELGHTEMKGSWFIFDKYYAHEDWCRWRAPYWHGSRVMDENSHHNYHLGFRCCKTIDGTRKK